MLVTAIPFSPVMAEDAGTTEAVQPVAMLDGKALGDAITLVGTYTNFLKSFDHVNQYWLFESNGSVGKGDDNNCLKLSLTENSIPASAHYVKVGLYSSVKNSGDNLAVFVNQKQLWAWNLNSNEENAENGVVFSINDDASKDGCTNWNGLSFEEGTSDVINSICFRPTKGGNVSDSDLKNATLKFKYIAFFSTKADADAYEYIPTYNYTVTYMNADSTVLATAYYAIDSNSLVHIKDIPQNSDSTLVFDGWYDSADGGKIWENGDSVTSNLTLYPHFIKVNDCGAIYDVNNITDEGLTYGSFLKESIQKSKSNSDVYYRFSPKQAYLGDNVKVPDGNGGTKNYDAENKIRIKFSNEDKINMRNYPVIAINYRGKSKSTSFETNMSISQDVWGNSYTFLKSGDSDEWKTLILNANEAAKFYSSDGIGSDYNTIKQRLDQIGFPGSIVLRLSSGQGQEIAADDYLDVRYIGFFSSEEAANNYKYPETKWYQVDFVGDSKITSRVLKEGAKISLPTKVPTKVGYAFDGWYDKPENQENATKITDGYAVNSDLKLYPHFVKPGAVFDAGSITASAAYSNFVSVSKQIDDNGYVYNIAKALKKMSAVETTDRPYGDFDNNGEKDGASKVNFGFNSDEEVNMNDYPIMAVCYRGHFYNGSSETNLTVDDNTLWSVSDVSCGNSDDWNLKLFDKNNEKKFYSDGSGGIKYPYNGILINWVPTNLMMRISNGQTGFNTDNHLDLLYIAFFKTEAQAKSYTYAPTTEWNTVTVTYSTDEAGAVTISGGEKLSETNDTDTKTATVTYIVRNGESVTFTATPGNDYNMDGWYNVTNGHNVLLGDGAGTIDLKVTSDTELNVRFLEKAVEKLGRLVVIPDRGVDGNAIGTISVDGVEGDSWIDKYVSKRNSTRLTASVKDAYSNDYAFAFWWRLSSKTESFLGATDEIDVYPLGNQVVYQPVFAKAGVTVKLYVDFANTVIGVIGAEVDNPDTEAPSVPKRAGYKVGEWVKDDTLSSNNVEVYKPSYTKIYENENSLTIVDSANNETTLTEENGLVYNAQVNLTPGQNHRHWFIIIENNGMDKETSVLLSHKGEYSYYHVLEGNVKISDVCFSEGTTAANGNYVHTLQVQQRDDNRIHFVASLNVNSGYELVERGVLMTNVVALANSESFKINTPGVIEGRINETEVTDIYLVAKGNVKAGDTWYGRAYMIVKNKGTGELETIYAAEILSKTYTESTTVTD